MSARLDYFLVRLGPMTAHTDRRRMDIAYLPLLGICATH